MKIGDEEIRQKLMELETAILKEQKGDLAPVSKNSELRSTAGKSADLPIRQNRKLDSSDDLKKCDLQYFGGMGLLMLGLFWLLQHVKVTSASFGWFGMTAGSSIGFLFIPLLIGIGWLIYNARSLWGWMISIVTLVLIVFTIISGLRIYFAPLSMLNVIFMLIPIAAGIALIIKGMGGPKGVGAAIKDLREKAK